MLPNKGPYLIPKSFNLIRGLIELDLGYHRVTVTKYLRLSYFVSTGFENLINFFGG